MKQRITGRVTGNSYEVVGVDGSVISSYPLDEARKDSRLAAAIKRNGWQELTDAG